MKDDPSRCVPTLLGACCMSLLHKPNPSSNCTSTRRPPSMCSWRARGRSSSSCRRMSSASTSSPSPPPPPFLFEIKWAKSSVCVMRKFNFRCCRRACTHKGNLHFEHYLLTAMCPLFHYAICAKLHNCGRLAITFRQGIVRAKHGAQRQKSSLVDKWVKYGLKRQRFKQKTRLCLEC